jgi:hypothetical protein
MSKHNDLSKEIDALLDELDRLAMEGTSAGNPKANTIALITAIRKFASIQAILTRQGDRQTRRIVALTWFLAVLTFGLLATALVQTGIMLKQDGSAQPQTIQTNQHDAAPASKK